MPFVKGDSNINRNGRPVNSEVDKLRAALAKEGEKHGIDFWDKVAEKAFVDNNIMSAVLKKFIPDMTKMELEGALSVLQMPTALVNNKPLEVDIGTNPA